jgi:hypothetical protein
VNQCPGKFSSALAQVWRDMNADGRDGLSEPLLHGLQIDTAAQSFQLCL